MTPHILFYYSYLLGYLYTSGYAPGEASMGTLGRGVELDNPIFSRF